MNMWGGIWLVWIGDRWALGAMHYKPKEKVCIQNFINFMFPSC